MVGDPQRRPDVSIAASASAEELRFETRPEVDVGTVGSGARDSSRSTRRHNLDSPVRPGKVYRRVFAATEVSGRLLAGGGQDER
jgi:hypothetical protein